MKLKWAKIIWLSKKGYRWEWTSRRKCNNKCQNVNHLPQWRFNCTIFSVKSMENRKVKMLIACLIYSQEVFLKMTPSCPKTAMNSTASSKNLWRYKWWRKRVWNHKGLCWKDWRKNSMLWSTKTLDLIRALLRTLTLLSESMMDLHRKSKTQNLDKTLSEE